MAINKGKVAGQEKNMREEIYEAAAMLFRRKGYTGTSMQDIADEVGILKGSIYYHFSSKDEIFREVLNRGIEPVLKGAESLIRENLDVQEKMRTFIYNHVNYIIEHNNSLVLFFQEREKLPSSHMQFYLEKRNRYEELLCEILKEGVEEGIFPHVDVKLTCFSIFGMCNWIIQWYDPYGPKSPEEIIEHMQFLICDLMLNQPRSREK